MWKLQAKIKMQMKKNKTVLFVLLFGLILNACGTVQEAFEAPRKNSSDEFLIEKKSPLSMPPDFEKLPEPKSKIEAEKFEEKSDLEELIFKSESNIDIQKSENQEIIGTLEELLIYKIKNN